MRCDELQIRFEPKIVVSKDFTVDIKKMKLCYLENEYPLEYTRIGKLIDVYGKGEKRLSMITVSEKTPMYVSCRNFLEKDTSMGRLHMDLILYNTSLQTFKAGIYNRSVGHINDVTEVEIHQVISGKVLVVIEEQEHSYWGIFRAGEYFEIPANCFHCTYVLEDATMVVNFYGNAFWEGDISKKPYTGNGNFYMIYKTEAQNEFLVQKNNGMSSVIKEMEKTNRYLMYQDISKIKLPISRNYKLNKSIFELFNEIN